MSRPAPTPRLLQLPFALLLALTALTISAPLLAQGGELAFEVVDAKGAKLADVKVTAADASGAVKAQGTTNKKGKIELKLAEAGDYLVTFETAGLAVSTLEVEVRAGMSTETTVTMIDQATRNRQLAVEAFNAAVGLLQSGKEKDALPFFQKASELDPQLAEAHRLVALVESNLGNLDAASAALERYLALDPEGLPKVAPAAYEVYRHQGKTDQLPAVREHLKALGIQGDIAIKVFNEGVKQADAKNKDAAMALFAESALLDPTLSPAYRSMAALHFNDQQYEQALPYLQKLLEVDSKNVEGHRLKFFALIGLERGEEATRVAKSWQALTPQAASSIVEQAEKMFSGNRTQDAEITVQAALAANPDEPTAHYLLGRIKAQQGMIAEAKTHLQRFLELAPQHGDAEAARQMLAGL